MRMASLCKGLYLFLIVCSSCIIVLRSEACKVNVCASEKHFADSLAYLNEGDLQLEDGSIKDSLAFYRAATRICSSCGLYWLKLAEAELQLGLRIEAKTRLLHAIGKVGSEEERIKQLLETELRNVDVVGDMWMDYAFPVMPELPGDGKTKVDSATTFGSEPWVLRNAFDVAVIHNTVGYELMRSKYGNEVVDYYPQNMKHKPNRVYHSTLRQALDFLEYPLGAYLSSDISEPGTYIQWNINATLFEDLLLDKLEYPAVDVSRHLKVFFDYLFVHSTLPDLDKYREPPTLTKLIQPFSRKTHWFMMMIGEVGSGMFMHTDNLPVASWQMQLEGSKRWVICKPIDDTVTHPSKNCTLTMNGKCMVEGSCQEVVLLPGDMLYYPPAYWHYTSCLSTPTVSLSGTVLPQHRPEALVSMVQKECRDNQLGYQFDRDLCRIVEHIGVQTLHNPNSLGEILETVKDSEF
jgi:tetratricopeptide (TPR) repeat protein